MRQPLSFMYSLFCVIICLGIPVHVFLAVHPFGKGFRHLVGIVVVILAVHRLSDIDPDLSSVKTVQRMRVLLGSGPDLISSCDIDGNKRDSCFDGEVRSAVLEFGELTGVCSCTFGEDEADVALFDFFLSFDKTSYGIAVAVDCDSASDSHDETAEFAVLCLKIGSREAAHPLEVSLGEIVDDKDSVGIALVVGSDYIRVVGRKILFSDALHITQYVREKKEAVLGDYIPESSLGRILFIQLAMMLSVRNLLFLYVL